MSPTGQATSPFENIKLIINALADYAKETGVDLSMNPFAAKLDQLTSPDDILQLLEGQERAFKGYREGNRRLTNFLNPVVKVLHGFSGILSEAAGLVSRRCHLVALLTQPCQIPFPPASLLFAGIDTLLGVRPLNTICSLKVPPVTYEFARPPVRFHRVMMPYRISSNIWGVSSSAWTSIQRSNSLP